MSLLDDVRQVRRGWHWGEVKPRSWPERAPAVPDRSSNLGWARSEPVRSARWLLQKGVSLPFTRVMANPDVRGAEWMESLERPAIIAANHSSHADLQLLLYALPDRARERTVVAAAADYWYQRPWLGRLVSLWLNTFPFSRTGGPQAVLHHSSQLLKSGWHLLIFPEGSRSPDGRLQEFKPGVGFLARETGAPVVPIHVRGGQRIMPKGRAYPLPAPAQVRIGRPLQAKEKESARAFAGRVESSVRELAAGSSGPEVVGSWIERWRAAELRSGATARGRS
ncbi:MAG: 1-acyl-sn-glycerol-3-phosphate acyltransferase [Candidatus Dormibacteraeota bacterium]|uniref:1-acyl-sn-glycerol-3-phosphate acyltransferase n=1 Tax=Candidatus Dormiibacter inghamiae TaxID=3127013 RepID=A0A934KAS0_9BACT|nr:1-acyl-sn-glycerol-3-phosphate acyltransferase [Candidatus Dormibacteraeota bacterium]MBJ7606989.1 1-acyl-sn-glycerol-3-phosphate acyltransferase [Candidatus Dormibacteraeota bacterium]